MSPTARAVASEAADDDIENRDDAVNDGFEYGTDAIDDSHYAGAD